MEIIPLLNLNKHPRNTENGSLIDAMNIMLSKDGVIETEYATKVNTVIYYALTDYYTNNYKIIYCIPCNTELIIFVREDNNSTLDIFRFNEEYNQCKLIATNFEYHEGNLLGDYIYNKNNLIICVSEYFDDDSNNIPLRTINLGRFPTSDDYLTTYDFIDEEDKNQLINNNLHSICPKVKIPTIINDITSGNAYKGWYYIFIRYKISKDTYTQWFNTNSSVFIDSYKNEKPFNYYVSKNVEIEDSNLPDGYESERSFFNLIISDETDIASNTFIMHINNIDTNYNTYQIGLICVSKSYTKGFYSDDITIEVDTIAFNKFKEYSIDELTRRNYNYYNVKSLCVFENKLYIGNYNEYNNKKVDCSDIELNINITTKIIDKHNITVSTGEIKQYRQFGNFKCYVNEQNKTDGFVYGTELLVNDNGTIKKLYNLTINPDTPIQIYVGGTHISGQPGSGSLSTYYNVYARDIYFAPNSIHPNLTTDIAGISNYGCADDNNDWDEVCNGNWDITYFKFKIGHETPNENPTANDYPYTFANHTYSDSDYSTIKSETIYEEKITTNNEAVLKSVCIKPYEQYSFYIHFINEYGEITNGYPIKDFNLNITGVVNGTNVITNEIIDTEYNKDIYLQNGRTDTIKINDSEYKIIVANFAINKLPVGKVGWFVTYESLERSEIYNCLAQSISNTETILWDDKINFEDNIDMSFNKIYDYGGTFTDKEEYILDETKEYGYRLEGEFSINESTYLYSSYYKLILSKELYVADDFNNMLFNTNIKIVKDSTGTYDSNIHLAKLKNDNVKYKNKIKTLIPCSNISYNTYDIVEVNTKTGFITVAHAIVYGKPNKEDGKYYYNDAVKYFMEQPLNNKLNANISSKAIIRPVKVYKWPMYDNVPYESICYNNKPLIVFFPILGLETENEKEKAFAVGGIIEAKDNVDVFKQKQVAYYTNYPISYTNNIDNLYEYPKTVRRSNVMQDESNNNAFRIFNLEDYKNINENKGNISKILGIGNTLIVHCEYSLFIFNKDNNIKSVNGLIQIGANDIWDVSYVDLFNDKLGYGGLAKEWWSINGVFGYIWFDKLNKEIYRLDGKNSISRVDNTITNYIKQLDIKDINFAVDTKNNRILINIKSNVGNQVISYNYVTNTIISRHSYNYIKSYTTNNDCYMLDTINNNCLVVFDTNNKLMYKGLMTDYNQDAYISVMMNESYDVVKFIDSIMYKISNIQSNSDKFIGVNTRYHQYAGKSIRIFNDMIDTGVIDTSDININNYNKFGEYGKPYYDLGNWNFNCLRNKLNNYFEGNVTPELMSRLYGNYFIFELTLASGSNIEIESVYAKYVNRI